MNDWKKYILVDVVDDIAMGPFGSNLKVDNFIESGVPVIRGVNLNEGGFSDDKFVFVSEEKANSLKRCLAYPDDLVFTHRGTLGQVGIIPKDKHEKYLVSQSQMRLRVNKHFLLPKYLYYFFKSPFGQRELLKNSSQVGVPAIANPTKSLKEVELTIPNLETQSQITSILSSFDDKIELNQQINQILEAMVQAIFKEWFVNFNFPGFDGELMDGLPKGWSYSNVEAIALELEVGNRPKGGVKEITDGIPSIGAESITSIGEYDFSKTKYIPIEFYNSMTRGKSKHLDILVYKDGGKPGNYIPHISMFGFDFPFKEYAINEHVYRIQCKDERMQGFLYFWMNTDNCIKEMKEKGTGVAIPGLNSTALKSVTVIQPDNDILNTFFEISNVAIERILRNSGEIRTLTQLRDSLLPKLMTGKIEIKN